MADDQEIEVTVRMPNTDFDAISLEIALNWVAAQLAQSNFPTGGEAYPIRTTYHVLQTLHTRFMRAIDAPDGWYRPDLETLIAQTPR